MHFFIFWVTLHRILIFTKDFGNELRLCTWRVPRYQTLRHTIISPALPSPSELLGPPLPIIRCKLSRMTRACMCGVSVCARLYIAVL